MSSEKNSSYSILMTFVIISIIVSSCSVAEGKDETYILVDEILTTQTNLIPDKETNIVSTYLQFKNIDNIEYLFINKSGGESYSKKISKGELSSTSYLFKYKVKKSDPDFFRLILKAVYIDGNSSKEISLNVDNRRGFFIRNVSQVARVTGVPISGETFPNPNNTHNWNVGGTDLGIVWRMEPGKYGIFFGDTFGRSFKPNPTNPGPNGDSWRSNVLAFSEDENLDDGLTISSMATDARGDAREIIYGGKDETGNGNWTSIPTAAIRANGADYVHYFNLRSWTGWITNYSGMYKSIDNGKNWDKCENVNFSANSPFGQVGYFKKDGYIYMIGTKTGRDSKPSLARFHEKDIEILNQYEYWNGETWIKGDENQATTIIDDKVGELSFIYNNTHKKWLIAYFNGDRYNITMRTAEQITGPWSDPYELASGKDYAQLYGSYFHPLSVKGDNLYFLMSMWMPYNVFLMKAEIADMGVIRD